MPYSLSLVHVESSQSISVNANMFGNNILTSTNTIEGVISEDFVEAVETVRSARLRYPAGRAELDEITSLTEGGAGAERLDPNFISYLEYIKGKGVETTLVLPSLNFESGDETELREWVQIVLDFMGADVHLIQAFEIGNEYWGIASEIQYGLNARMIVQALREALPESTNIDILVQTANVVGGSSLYKGADNGNISIDAAISALSHWSQGERPSDWSEGMDAADFYYSLSSFEKRILEANLELLQHFDHDSDVSNGFQINGQGVLFDGIVAHYYYDKYYQAFDASEDETRDQNKYLDLRFTPWQAMTDQDLSIQITEWNVESDHYNDLGLKAAGALLEQFENMLELGVDAADFWTLRHNTTSAAAGSNGDTGTVRLTPAGSALQMMHESMVFADGSTLNHRQVSGFDGSKLNVNFYSDDYTSIIYLSSRVEEFDLEVTLDASFLPESSYYWRSKKICIDVETSDGLSENRAYDEEGNLVSRTPKREIDARELERLQAKLGGAYSEALVKVIDGRLLTYLPEADDILLRPEVSSPSSLDDFYFAAESDVSSFVLHQDMSDLGLDLSALTFVFDPYEVVELTIYHSRFVYGNDGDESISGGRGVDIINGEDGSDTIFGLGENDSLKGQLGDDSLSGGDGEDTLVGGWGNDTLLGGAGSDNIIGGEGNDTIFGDSEASLEGSSVFGDTIEAGNGDDFIFSGSGDDLVDGGDGADLVYLGEGDDTFTDNDPSTVDGRDTVFGGWGNDTILGSGADDVFHGDGGADLIEGGAGNDRLYGGAQYDTLTSGDGRDTVYGGNGRDLAFLGTGADVFVDNGLGGHDGSDTVYAGWGNDTIQGGEGDDFFNGQGNDDSIAAGNGNDTVLGGNGRDFVTLNVGHDLFIDSSEDGFTGRDTVYGGWGNDTIQGGGGGDSFFGNWGHDLISGGRGNDALSGDDGNDTLAGEAGDDLLAGGAGADSFVFAIGTSNDVITDFQQGGDTVLIDASLTGAGSIADLVNAAQISGGGVTVTFSTGGSVFFVGLTGTSGLVEDFGYL